MIEVTKNVTAFLGEDVILSCRYLGEESDIQSAEWKGQLSPKSTVKRLAGFNSWGAFGRYGFSEPDSIANLTVVKSVSSVDMEGKYTCQFVCEEDYYSETLSITVVGKQASMVVISGSQQKPGKPDAMFDK